VENQDRAQDPIVIRVERNPRNIRAIEEGRND
jgi:hypothetical protein